MARRLQRLGALLLSSSWLAAGEVSKDVVEHMKCQACQMAIAEAVLHAAELKARDEDTLSDLVDGLCTVKKPEGKWTAKYDIVQKGKDGPLTMVKQEGIGICKSECLALQRGCAAVLKNKEETIVSMLLSGKKAEDIEKKVCKKICSKKLPPLKDFNDEPYRPRDPKEVEAEERVEKMRAETGQNFKMWSREEIASMSQADIELEAAKDALGAQRREAKLAKEAEERELGIRPAREL
mmetsp:Transcript_32532/g.95198  ORF Transcript_32532/g.95198 Transcript_32532/m.95198 type:complete len:237 (-) Transcript_32532:126-836(-)